MNKVRLLVTPWGPDNRTGVNASSRSFPVNAQGTALDLDRIDTAHWMALDKVMDFLYGQGIIADLILFHDGDSLWTPFGSQLQNERYTRYVAARYAAVADHQNP